MTAAFIVSLEVDGVDPSSLALAAEEIHDLLEGSFAVESVKPWARPVTAPQMPGSSPSLAAGFTPPPFPTGGLGL